MMQLHVNGDQAQVIRLQKSIYLVGRSNVCNLRFTDPGLELVHARLKVEPHALSVMSQDSAEIRVNGARITGETTLGHGDELVLGATKMKVVDAQQEIRAEADSRAEPSPVTESPVAERQPESEDLASGWILQGVSPGLISHRYAINGTALMGRARECDIHINEAHLSRQHVRFTLSEDGLVVEDLNSANGTYVNGRRVNAAVLQNGDELSLDSVKFRIIHTSTSTEETLVQPELAKPKATEVTGPTAIDIQRATLRQMRDEQRSHRALTAGHVSNATMSSGWLALAAMTVVLVGVLWGATSFLATPFRG